MAEIVETDQPLTPAGRLFLQPLLNQVINCAFTGEHPIAIDSLKTETTSPIYRSVHLFPSINPCGRFTSSWRTKRRVSCHHALGDRIPLMSMLLSSCRRADDPARTRDICGVGASALGPRRWSVWTVAKVAWFSLVYVLEFLMRVLWMRDKTTAVSGGDRVEHWPRRLATARFRLDDMKIVKKAVAGSTINDVQFGVVSSRLSRYLHHITQSSTRRGPTHRCGHGQFETTARIAGIADMQILVAKDIIPDPKVLAKCFEDALSEMKQAAEDHVLKNLK